MSTVVIKPIAEDFGVLEAGQYGPGLQNEATVELTEFEAPNGDGLLDRMPGFDRDGERGPYYRFNVKVTLASGGTQWVTDWRKPTNQFKSDLRNCGVDVADNADGTFAFDPETVAPRELGGVEVKAPRQDKNDDTKRWPGNIKGFIAK